MANVIHTLPIKSIRFFPGGFSFLKWADEVQAFVFKSHANTSLASLPFVLSAFFSIQSQDKSEKLEIVMSDMPPVLVPKELYEENRKPEYLKYQFDISSIGSINVDEIENYMSLYCVSAELENCLSRLSLPVDFKHQSTNLYGNLRTLGKIPGNKNALSLHINEDYVDFILHKSGELTLLNRFTFTSDFDILYYVLNILKQYRIEARECNVILSGILEQKQELPTLLKQYLPFVETASVEAVSLQNEAGRKLHTAACFDLLKLEK